MRAEKTSADDFEISEELLVQIKEASDLGFTAIEASQLLEVREEDVVQGLALIAFIGSQEKDNEPKNEQDNEKKESQKPRGPRRGHFSKNVKHDLAAQGKLNAKKPMPKEQKKARRKKRKKRK